MDWTDDVRIRVRPGRSVDELVDRILDASDSVRATPAFLAAVAGEFALSFEQARLALDRVQGGRVRAAGDGARRPDDDKDPVAASAWRRVTGARPATRNHDGSRWPALTEALAADSIADLRARLTSPAFAAAASADDRRAATVWTDAVATGAAPAEPIDAAAIERLVALAVATVELPDGLGVRDGVLRLTAALTAHAGADARERRGDEPIAAGTAAWFEAVTLAEASATLAALFARTGDVERAHDSFGLHCAVVTGLLGPCHERVAAAVLGFAQAAAHRGDRATALDACRDLTADLADSVVARCEADGGAPEAEDVLALAGLDDALTLQVELGGDGPEVSNLRARIRHLLAGTGTGSVLTGDDPLVALAAVLAHHQVEATVDGEWLRLPRGVRARARMQTLSAEALQLDVIFEPWLGTPIIESCAGFGASVAAQRGDAWRTFTLGTLHVLLAAFLYVDNDVRRTSWAIDDSVRAVTFGDVVGRGHTPAVAIVEDVVRAIVESSTLPEGTHWIRAFVAQRDDEVVVTEMLLDNEPWDYGHAELAAVAWPPAQGGASVRLFLVIQGGVDVGRAVAELIEGSERDDDAIAAAMIERGVAPLDAALMVALVPLAWGRMMLAQSGVTLAADVSMVSRAGEDRGAFAFEGHPIVEEALWAAERGTLTKDQFLSVACRSPEVALFEELNDRGDDPARAELGPPTIVVP